MCNKYLCRLCRYKSYASDNYSARLQDLPHVCHNKYRGHGYFFLVSHFWYILYINLALTTTFSFLPETKGCSLEEMDIIFGSTSRERREADIAKQERGEFSLGTFEQLPLTSRPSSV